MLARALPAVVGEPRSGDAHKRFNEDNPDQAVATRRGELERGLTGRRHGGSATGTLPAIPREINPAAARALALLAPPVMVRVQQTEVRVDLSGVQPGRQQQLHLFVPSQPVEQHTLGEAIERYRLEHLLLDGLSQSTIAWREAALRRLAAWADRPLDGRWRDVGARVYADARRRAAQRGSGSGEAGASLIVNTLARVLNLAESWGWRCGRHDLGGICRVRSGKRVVHLQRSELAAIGEQLGELVASGRRVAEGAACSQLIFMSGMRVSEAATLQWVDVDFDASVIHLPTSKTGPRDVVLGPVALEMLRTRKLRSKSRHVFPNRRGDRPINRRQVLDALQLACTRAHAPKAVVHALRHHFATLGAKLELPTKTMSLALGHSVEWQTTEYQHVDLEDVRRVVASIEKQVASALAGKVAR